MKILVVDDEKLIREVIKEYLLNDNYEVLEASNGTSAIEICKKENIDLIIMDIMMPKLDGFSAIREIFKTKKIPTVMLSARGEEYDKLLGFELGIEDYVTKPFSPKELMARIKVILKRDNKEHQKYIYETLVVDVVAHTVTIDDKEIELTPKEYDLLVNFFQNENVALSREQLLSTIWGYDFFGDDRTVDTHIKMLRNKLGKYRDIIKTVRSVGYKLETK
ncbi:MAG: response regulator transcription factor [Bacilli bacterium]